MPLTLLMAALILNWMQTSAAKAGKVDIVSLMAQRIVYPVQWPINGIASGISDLVSGIWNARSLKRRVQQLEAELAAAKRQPQEIERLRAEIRRLRTLLNMPDYANKKEVAANVVGYFPEEHRIMLNVGTRRGVSPGDPIIAPEGLVGQVVQVAGASCYANLITNPDFSVGARVERAPSEAVGVVKGRGEALLLLDVYYEEADVQEQDVIATSGLSDIYPPGIRIGIVADVWSDKDFGMRKGVVIPFFNINRLREVVVLTR